MGWAAAAGRTPQRVLSPEGAILEELPRGVRLRC
jgi:hypothetical protein